MRTSMNLALAPLLGALITLAPTTAQLITQTPNPTGRNLGGVAFNTPDHGFVVGDNHTLIETFDGLIYALLLGGTFGWLWP